MLVLQILYYWLVFSLRGIPSSRAALLRRAEKRLQRKLRWVVQNMPFYRRQLEAMTSFGTMSSLNLTDFPILNKAIFNAHFAELNEAGISRDEAYTFALQAEQTGQFRAKLRGLTVGLSTGTSGNRGVFMVSDREIAQWVAMVLVRVLRLNPLRRQRIAFVFRTNSNLYQATNVGVVTMRFFPLDLDSPTVLHNLSQFNPTTLVGQPSALIRLAEYRTRKQLTIAPNRVISVAEVLTERDRDYLSRAFGATIHQVYQCMEGFLAHTCEQGNLHVNEDVLHWEKRYLDVEEHRYHPILTDFTRQTQALVRYELNDILVEPDAPCPCGSPFTQIGQIEGRADDVLVFTNQTGQPAVIFPDLIRRAVCDSSDAIVNYAVYQSNAQSILVYLDETLLPDTRLYEAIRVNLTTLLMSRAITGVTVSFLPYGQRGPETKLRRVKRDPSLPVSL